MKRNHAVGARKTNPNKADLEPSPMSAPTSKFESSSEEFEKIELCRRGHEQAGPTAHEPDEPNFIPLC